MMEDCQMFHGEIKILNLMYHYYMTPETAQLD